MESQTQVAHQLREAGFKATPARIALMSLLAGEAQPLDVPSILRRISRNIDQATAYRTLHLLVEAGLVRQLHLKPGITHYEFARRPHHHHVVCEQCGLVEDVQACCEEPRPMASAFRKVTSHHLEYSGICKACAG